MDKTILPTNAETIKAILEAGHGTVIVPFEEQVPEGYEFKRVDYLFGYAAIFHKRSRELLMHTHKIDCPYHLNQEVYLTEEFRLKMLKQFDTFTYRLAVCYKDGQEKWIKLNLKDFNFYYTGKRKWQPASTMPIEFSRWKGKVMGIDVRPGWVPDMFWMLEVKL